MPATVYSFQCPKLNPSNHIYLDNLIIIFRTAENPEGTLGVIRDARTHVLTQKVCKNHGLGCMYAENLGRLLVERLYTVSRAKKELQEFHQEKPKKLKRVLKGL